MTFGAIRGIDISHWNEVRDVDKVAAQCDFIYFKCSQGKWTSPTFKQNYAAFKGKTYRGIYPFLDYAQAHYTKGKDLEWGAEQADYVYALVKDDMPELPLWCDTENNEGDLSWERITTGVFGNISRVLKVQMGFKLRWHALTGKKMAVYTRKQFAEPMHNFTDGCLSIAAYPYDFMNSKGFVTNFGNLSPTHYPSSNGYIDCTGAWKGKWTWWQYSSTGLLEGLKGAVDLDVFNGDEVAWSEFVGKSLPVTTPVEVEDETPTAPAGVMTCREIVNIRNGVGTLSPQLYANNSPCVLNKGETPTVYETALDSAGNTWGRIGWKEWCAINFKGKTFLS